MGLPVIYFNCQLALITIYCIWVLSQGRKYLDFGVRGASWLRSQFYSGKPVPQEATLLQERVDEMRIAFFTNFINMVIDVIPVVALVVALVGPYAFPGAGPAMLRDQMFNFAGLAVCVCFRSHNPKGFRIHHIELFSVFLLALLMLRTISVQTSAAFWVTLQCRGIVRILWGLMLLNNRLSLVGNCLFSFVNCVLYPSVSTAVYAEGLCLLVSQAVLFHVEKLVQEHCVTKLDLYAAQNAERAVRKILSVLCDAEVRLGPDLMMIAPTKRLLNMLSLTEPLDHHDFLSFVADVDKNRFIDFLSAPGDALDDSPPSSIRLRLQDSQGYNRPVDLFHAFLVEVNNSYGHIVGIRESESDVKETLTYESRSADLALNRDTSLHVTSSSLLAPLEVPIGSSASLAPFSLVPRNTNGDDRRSDRTPGSLPSIPEEASGALLSGFEITPSIRIRQAIQHILDHINPLNSDCCAYHSTIAAVTAPLKEMKRVPCMPQFEPFRDWQCGRCNFMQQSEELSSDDDEGNAEAPTRECWHCWASGS